MVEGQAGIASAPRRESISGPLSLVTIRYESDANESMAICAGVAPEGMARLLRDPFTHPVFNGLEDRVKIEFALSNLERHLLDTAGVALHAKEPKMVKEEAFFDDALNESGRGFWLDARIAGKLAPRKAKVVEATLREWLILLFGDRSSVILPTSRQVPVGDEMDLGAMRHGWRSEIRARWAHMVAQWEAESRGPESLDPDARKTRRG